jgi:hypothetical protein
MKDGELITGGGSWTYDGGEITITDSETITFPESSDWECQLFGSGSTGIVWTPEKGKEPNRFWRWMQYLFFGNRWVKK